VSQSSHRTRAHVVKKMTPPPHLRRDRFGRWSAAATRSFACPVFAPFRSPSRALGGRPLRTMDTINDHLVWCTLPVLVRAKTTLLQISDRPGQAEKPCHHQRNQSPPLLGWGLKQRVAYCCDFSSSVACRPGSGGCPSSARSASTSRFAVAYSPSVICCMRARSSAHLP